VDGATEEAGSGDMTSIDLTTTSMLGRRVWRVGAGRRLGARGWGRGVGSGVVVGLGLSGGEEGDRTCVEDAAVHDAVERACPGAAGGDRERPWPGRSRATVWTSREESDERTQSKDKDPVARLGMMRMRCAGEPAPLPAGREVTTNKLGRDRA
jgi:hypothetical protein